MHFKISILSTNCFMAIYEILFNVDSIQALQCEIFSYVYELNLYSVHSWQIIILLELSRHPIELSIKLIVLSILLFYSIFFKSKEKLTRSLSIRNRCQPSLGNSSKIVVMCIRKYRQILSA